MNSLVVMQKEMRRFFRDPRMVLTVLLLPGLMIYLMYSFMGDALANNLLVDEEYVYKVAVVESSESFAAFIEAQDTLRIDREEIARDAVAAYKDKVAGAEIDLLLVFPENFDRDIGLKERTEPMPCVEMYYDATVKESESAYRMAVEVLDALEDSLTGVFEVSQNDLAPENEPLAEMLTMLVPMMIMIFVFSGCLSVAPESIAGEKERGTMATLLVTPTKRSEIAIGKIVSLAVIALCGGVSSALGVMLSLPKLMGGETADSSLLGMFSYGDYGLLALLILTTALLLVALISVISALAKSVKEAAAAAMPLMIVVMLVGVSAMFGSGAKTEIVYYLIPLYNTVQGMVGIFNESFILANILTAVASNAVYTMAAAFVLTKMFSSEKVMFGR